MPFLMSHSELDLWVFYCGDGSRAGLGDIMGPDPHRGSLTPLPLFTRILHLPTALGTLLGKR